MATHISRTTALLGDSDIASAAALFADPARARVLTALGDGRALPASVLATEARLSPSGVSAHLSKLLASGLVTVEPSGRHRYYRLAGEHIARVLEALATLAPQLPVTSLRAGTRANALRWARSCYDHLAGQLGVAVTAGLLERGALIRTDTTNDSTDISADPVRRRASDPLSSQLKTHPYDLGPHAEEVFGQLGVELAKQRGAAVRRPLLRFCVDWSEQRHHLSGRLGAAVLSAALERDWLTRPTPGHRAVRLTSAGTAALATILDIRLDTNRR